MIVKKIASTYNEYSLTVAWSQLIAIQHALAENHADVIRDELHKTLSWYLENVCPPGMDEDEFKKTKSAEKEAEKSANEADKSDERDLAGIGEETEFGAETSSGKNQKSAKKDDGENPDDYLSAPPME